MTLGFHPLACTFASPCLGCKPKPRVVTHCCYNFFFIIFSLFFQLLLLLCFLLLFCFSYRFFLLFWLFFIFSFFLFLYYYNLFIILFYFPFPSSSIFLKNHIVALVAIAYCIIISYAHHAKNAYTFFLVFFCFG